MVNLARAKKLLGETVEKQPHRRRSEQNDVDISESLQRWRDLSIDGLGQKTDRRRERVST